MKRVAALAVAAAGMVTAVVLKRRKADADAALWREATSDSSR